MATPLAGFRPLGGTARRYEPLPAPGEYGPVGPPVSRRQAQTQAGRPLPRPPSRITSAQAESIATAGMVLSDKGVLWIAGRKVPRIGDTALGLYRMRLDDMDILEGANAAQQVMGMASHGGHTATLIRPGDEVRKSYTQWVPGSDAFCMALGWAAALDLLYLQAGEGSADRLSIHYHNEEAVPAVRGNLNATECINTRIEWDNAKLKRRLRQSGYWQALRLA